MDIEKNPGPAIVSNFVDSRIKNFNSHFQRSHHCPGLCTFRCDLNMPMQIRNKALFIPGMIYDLFALDLLD